MYNANEIKKAIENGDFSKPFSYLYSKKSDQMPERYLAAVSEFVSLFGDGDLRVFSAPGRTEVGGNHTDHQHGCVVCAATDLDIIAIVKKTDTGIIRVKSKGYARDEVDLSVLEPQKPEAEHANALIRGVAARFKQLGYEIGGFDAYTTSDVLKGSGLSSSAAFEIMICTLLSCLYNDGKVDPVEAAIISQYAENEFFKKPCGLMDQTACSVGGFVGIDFMDTSKPKIEKVDFNFAAAGHSLCIVDTGGSHSDLTNEYAAVPSEMREVAACFNKEYLRAVDEDEFYRAIPLLREKLSDRAILRAIHFYDDNKRAVKMKNDLKKGDFESFLKTVRESGLSSLSYLQNVFAASAPQEQGLTLALAITEHILGSKGAFRVHGGGFAGTIQAYVPDEMLDTYKTEIERVFGAGSCYVLSVRPIGGVEVTPTLGE